MNKSNIHQLRLVKQASQDAKEGIFTMNGLSRTRFIHSIIHEYAHYDNGSYSLDINILSLSDKRLLISHFASAKEYEFSNKSPTKTEVIFKEYESHMQSAVDDECFTVYKENMEEMGMVMNRHHDNGEAYWVRR
jgi:hypothetical protein